MEQVGQADAEAGRCAALGGCEATRREPGGVQQVIEPVAGVRVVVPGAPREPRRVVADEHDVEPGPEHVFPGAASHGEVYDARVRRRRTRWRSRPARPACGRSTPTPTGRGTSACGPGRARRSRGRPACMAVAGAIAMQGTQRLGVHAEWSRKHGTAGDAAWSALAPMTLILIPAVLAIVADSAFLFVGLGPIILQAIERPLAPASSP